VKDKKSRWLLFLYYGGILTGAALFLYHLVHGLQGFCDQPIGPGQMPYIIAAGGTILVAYALQMLAYACLLRGLDVSIPVTEVLAHYVLSFLPRYIPGTVWGYLGRSEWLRMRCGIPYSTSALSSMLEAGIGLLTAVVVSGVSYSWYAAPALFRWITLLAAPLTCWLSWYALAMASRLPLLRRTRWLPFSPDTRINIRLGYWLLTCFLYYLLWFCYGGMLNLLLQTLTQRSVGLTQPIFAYALAWTAGFLIPLVPSGLGARETVLSSLLIQQLQLSAQSASAVSVACRIVVYVAELMWLVAGQILARITAKRTPEQ
jgi:hypothetical protein